MYITHMILIMVTVYMERAASKKSPGDKRKTTLLMSDFSMSLNRDRVGLYAGGTLWMRAFQNSGDIPK
jgi:hypothetical protein